MGNLEPSKPRTDIFPFSDEIHGFLVS